MAMTGEITLRGRVLGVGGLKEKVLAAHQANIYRLLIPLENKKDLADIPPKIRQRIDFKLVDSMDRVIEEALLDPPFDEESDEQDKQDKQDSARILPLQLDERPSTTAQRNGPGPVLRDNQ